MKARVDSPDVWLGGTVCEGSARHAATANGPADSLNAMALWQGQCHFEALVNLLH
jgi:hypothetical protein